LATLALVMLAGAPARSADEIFLVQYIDVTPAGAKAATEVLRDARTAARKADGNLQFEAYAEGARPSRLAMVSLWRDQKAVEAYGASAIAKQLRDKLEPVRVTPFDERTLSLLAGDAIGGAGRSAPKAGAIHIVTHMDSIPPFKDEAAGALKTLAAASVKDAGVARYQVLVQTNRQNHFKLIETWADQKALDAHIAAAHTKQFRDFVQKGTGSPYDERIYKALP
jgi:quinol monooxygenase YgiN